MFPGDNQIRVTSSARANLFLILDGVDGVDHGSPETLALQLPHTDDGRTAGRTDGILHHGGMLPRGELQLSRTDDHLAGHAVGIGTHDAVLDGSVILECDGERSVVRRGETFYLHGRTFHYLTNERKTAARVLWVCTPPLF